MWNFEFTSTRFFYSSGYSRIFSLFSIFLLTFLRLHIETNGAFFHVVASNPSRGLLTRIGDRSPFGATTWEKRRTRVPLVFHVEAAARASSPIRGTFSANRSENFAVSDVCNWQIILMVILVNRTSFIPWLMRDIWCRIDINRTHWDCYMLRYGF